MCIIAKEILLLFFNVCNFFNNTNILLSFMSLSFWDYEYFAKFCIKLNVDSAEFGFQPAEDIFTTPSMEINQASSPEHHQLVATFSTSCHTAVSIITVKLVWSSESALIRTSCSLSSPPDAANFTTWVRQTISPAASNRHRSLLCSPNSKLQQQHARRRLHRRAKAKPPGGLS